tara:strand:+ start:2456 stop:3541 length:1086 start_codon:yes stop_codon:yes gene_type:complete
MDKYKFDVAIIGAGVIGLAIAERLSRTYKNIIVLDKEKSFGQHISSRNSEVIHSGIYYPDKTLKSQLCIKGNYLLYKFLNQYDIPYSNCGKLIVASNTEEDKILDNIFLKGIDKNIPNIKCVSSGEAKLIEPHISCTKAIWVPSSGIMDSHKLMQRLEYNFKLNDGVIAYNSMIKELNFNGLEFNLITDSNDSIDADIVINATGLWSDRISSMLGIDRFKIHYCKGEYYKTNRYKNLNCLIYPVPSDISLGIHVVLQLNGDVSFGPNAHYVDKIDYSIDDSSKNQVLNDIKKYIDIEGDDIWPDFSGIRPKLQAEGQSFEDFYINNEFNNGVKNFINLIGIDSPGLTSSLAIAEYVETLII